MSILVSRMATPGITNPLRTVPKYGTEVQRYEVGPQKSPSILDRQVHKRYHNLYKVGLIQKSRLTTSSLSGSSMLGDFCGPTSYKDMGVRSTFVLVVVFYDVSV